MDDDDGNCDDGDNDDDDVDDGDGDDCDGDGLQRSAAALKRRLSVRSCELISIFSLWVTQSNLSGCFAYKDDDDDDDDGEFDSDSFLHFSMLYFHLSPLYHLVNLFHHWMWNAQFVNGKLRKFSLFQKRVDSI